MRKVAEGRPNVLLTLTVSSKNYSSEDEAARDLKRGLVLLRRALMREHKVDKLPFIAVFERHKSGWPHLHLAVRVKFIDWQWWRDQWERITGSWSVNLRFIPKRKKIASYVAKYLGKDLQDFDGCKRWWRSHNYRMQDEEDYQPLKYPYYWQLDGYTLERVERNKLRQGFIIENETPHSFTFRYPWLPP